MVEKETKSCSDCIHFDVCYKIEHFGRDLEDTSPCEQFISKDVAPVRHGHWTEIDHSKNLGDYHFVCSECKCNTPDRAYVITPNFCPNCGAKMGGEEND